MAFTPRNGSGRGLGVGEGSGVTSIPGGTRKPACPGAKIDMVVVEEVELCSSGKFWERGWFTFVQHRSMIHRRSD